MKHRLSESAEKPQFLKEDDIIALKKDSCIFCNGLFKVDCIHESGVAESRGDHGMGGGEYHWTHISYTPREINLYLFSCSFLPEEQKTIYSTKEALKQRLTREIRTKAEWMREDLKKKIDLPVEQKQRAIDAIVNDCLAELESESRGFFQESKGSKLDQRLETYFHTLFLGDLKLIAEHRTYYGQGWDDTIHYGREIKSHTTCWPYKKVADEVEEERLVPYRKFLEHLQANPRFAGYQARLEEFPEIFDLTRKLSVQLKVHRFDPFTRT